MIRAGYLVTLATLVTMAVFPKTGMACERASVPPALFVQSGKNYDLEVRPIPAPLRSGEPFALRITICPKTGAGAAEAIIADAAMPDHRHGMNYKPRITRTGPNRFDADGFLLHMPGRWQFAIEVRSGAVRELITWDVTVP